MFMENKLYKKATFWERLLAIIIDEIILFVIIFVFSIVLSQVLDTLTSLFFWILSILYGTLFIWKYGHTPGKKLLQLRVVNTAYQPVSFGTALLRESIGKWLSGLFLNLGYLWVFINGRRQAWHDKLAKTFVVKTDNTGALIPIDSEEPVTTRQKVTFAAMFLVIGLPIPAATLFLIVYVFFAQPFQIAGNAMVPNYVDGQYYLVNKMAYRTNEPTRGDVIVFRSPQNAEKDLTKRVIGVPGDIVSIQNGMVYLNGQVLDESAYIKGEVQTYGGEFLKEGESVTVPENHYFVLGDNRPFSSDSREWGFVSKKSIIGKMAFCYYKCSLSKPNQ